MSLGDYIMAKITGVYKGPRGGTIYLKDPEPSDEGNGYFEPEAYKKSHKAFDIKLEKARKRHFFFQ